MPEIDQSELDSDAPTPGADGRRARRERRAAEPLLTPFPYPGYLVHLRRSRQRRRRLIGGVTAAAAIALGIVGAGVGSVLSNQLDPNYAAAASAAAVVESPLADSVSAATVSMAETARSDAFDGVDTEQLSGYIESLDGATAADVYGIVDETVGEVASVGEESAVAAEEQRLAEEIEAEAQRVAEELAAANTVQGAQATAQRLSAETYGWGESEFGCLVSLWNKESGWNYQAQNASSGAYGIPQSLPGSKMSAIADDWATNAATQITWGLGYIASVYGTPCGAWGHSQSVGWY